MVADFGLQLRLLRGGDNNDGFTHDQIEPRIVRNRCEAVALQKLNAVAAPLIAAFFSGDREQLLTNSQET